MTPGIALTARDVHLAVTYNRARFDASMVREIQQHMGYRLVNGVVNDAFVRAVADWQETRRSVVGPGDGAISPPTEAHLNLLIPQAVHAVRAAVMLYTRGGYLYDGWNNDMRDNTGNGLVDAADPAEVRATDGSHFSQTYHRFWVRGGTYAGGWPFARRTVVVAADREVRGEFHYRNCADIISSAYNAAGVMPRLGHTEDILNHMRRRGFVWQRGAGYPDQYLPGDFICTLQPGHGGHSGIVVQPDPTDGGRRPPVIIDLPGPSSQVSEGIYGPAHTNDLQRHRWPTFRLTQVPLANQYLARLLHSRVRGR